MSIALLPNTRVQRTRSSPSAFRSPLTRHPLGRPGVFVGLAWVMGTALVASGQTGTGDIDFVGRATITAERNDGLCASTSAAVAEMSWTPLDLSEPQASQVRRLLVAAIKANKANEAEAARHGQATGGVPGCMSAEFRLIFRLKGVTQKAIVHLCGGWLGGDPKVGSILLSDKQKVKIQGILGDPCR
jgi:hypothetical protein